MVLDYIDAKHFVVRLLAFLHHLVVRLKNALDHFGSVGASPRHFLHQLVKPNCVHKKTFLKTPALVVGYAQSEHGIHINVHCLGWLHCYSVILLGKWLIRMFLDFL